MEAVRGWVWIFSGIAQSLGIKLVLLHCPVNSQISQVRVI